MLIIYNKVNLISGVNMDKKEIQEERMRGYFIQATKDILKGEGLRALSVRNVAERAGYSYATLYNYFKDVKDLIFECVHDFQDECKEAVESETKKVERGLPKVRAITKSYIKYFIQYPGTFELFYIEKPYNLAGKQPTLQLINTLLDRLCAGEWDYLVSNNLIGEDDAGRMKTQLKYIVVGILLLYLTRKHPETYSEFNEIVETQLQNILGI